MAIFGARQTHEDDIQKAIEAAFDIQQAAQDARFEVNTGVNTGVVYLTQHGTHSAAEIFVSGPVVNLALRLQSQSQAGQIF